MNVVMMATGEFAVPILEKLSSSPFKPVAAVTAPDRPAGRGQELTPPPVKTAAQALGIRVLQPADVNAPESLRELNGLMPDLIVVADYGQKLGNEILALPRYYCINVHPSLLPRYRGASPVVRALAGGDAYTGVTVIRLVERMDAGPILGAVKVEVPPQASAGDLERLLSGVGADLMVSVIQKIRQGIAVEVPQDERHASYASKVAKVDGKIRWTEPAEKIVAFVRSMTPSPGAYTMIRGERTGIPQVRAVVLKDPPSFPAGTVVAVDRKAIWVACGDGVIGIEKLHPAGKTSMATSDYLNGHRVKVGESLG